MILSSIPAKPCYISNCFRLPITTKLSRNQVWYVLNIFILGRWLEGGLLISLISDSLRINIKLDSVVGSTQNRRLRNPVVSRGHTPFAEKRIGIVGFLLIDPMILHYSTWYSIKFHYGNHHKATKHIGMGLYILIVSRWNSSIPVWLYGMYHHVSWLYYIFSWCPSEYLHDLPIERPWNTPFILAVKSQPHPRTASLFRLRVSPLALLVVGMAQIKTWSTHDPHINQPAAA